MELTLPATPSPREDPSGLWSMQVHLLKLAEDILGPRDTSKLVYQPVFHDDGPHIRNTPNLDGAFAELSRNAEGYWPTALYELAHETVHLLNPRPGIGNWLEEGIAVAFSRYSEQRYGLYNQCIGMDSYRRALELVSRLPSDPLVAGRLIREACGALNNATENIVMTLFPGADSGTLTEICKQFERDWSDPVAS